MTEKRFEPIADHNGFVEYIRDNAQKKIGLLTFDEFIDTVNTLHEKNQCLKEKLCELGISDVKYHGKRINTGLEEWLE